MRALHNGSTDDLEISPNLWAGVGLVRGGAGTALVGSHAEVADRIAEYHELGIDEFVLSGYPHLEEAWQVGEGVFPILRAPVRARAEAGTLLAFGTFAGLPGVRHLGLRPDAGVADRVARLRRGRPVVGGGHLVLTAVISLVAVIVMPRYIGWRPEWARTDPW